MFDARDASHNNSSDVIVQIILILNHKSNDNNTSNAQDRIVTVILSVSAYLGIHGR